MFKDIIELDKQVVDRIVDKVHENNLEIEMEMGVVKDGMVKVLFLYEDRNSGTISERTYYL